MRTFLEFHLSIMSKYNDEFVKITKIQQAIFNKETKKDIEDLRRKVDEIQINLPSSSTSHYDNKDDFFTLNFLERFEPQAFNLLQHCAYLNPDVITPAFFVGHGEEDGTSFRFSSRTLFDILKKHNVLFFDQKKCVYLIRKDLQQQLQRKLFFKEEVKIINQVALLLKEKLRVFDEYDVSTWELVEECFNHFDFLNNENHWDKVDLKTKVEIFINLRGYVTHVLMNYTKSIKFFNDSICAYDEFFKSKENPEIIISLNSLGKVYENFGEYNEAKKHYEVSFAIGKRIYKHTDHLDIAASLNNLGKICGYLGQYREAKGYFEDSLAMRRRIYWDKDHKDIAFSLSNLGNIYAFSGDQDKAKKYLEDSLSMVRRIYQNKDHPNIAFSLYSFGCFFSFIKEHKTAREYLENSLKMYKRIYGTRDHVEIAEVLASLGDSYCLYGFFDKLEKHCESALTMKKNLYGEKHKLFEEYKNSLFWPKIIYRSFLISKSMCYSSEFWIIMIEELNSISEYTPLQYSEISFLFFILYYFSVGLRLYPQRTMTHLGLWAFFYSMVIWQVIDND